MLIKKSVANKFFNYTESNSMYKPSVVHLISSLITGGAERALYALLREGLKDNYNCSVISLLDEGVYGAKIKALGIPVYCLNTRRGIPNIADVFRLRQIISRIEPKIIQGWMYHGNIGASLASFLSTHDSVLAWNIRHSLHDLSAEKVSTRQVIRINRLLSSRAASIIYNSFKSRIQHEEFGFDSTSGLVIQNGFNIDELKPNLEKRAKFRDLLGFKNHDIVAGHVARFHPMKDHAGFLRAAVHVASQNQNLRFLLVGRNVNLDNPKLKEIVPKELLDRFHFLGERSDVYDLMQAIDVLCSSSAWGESFPNVIGEAMALGIPCIATDVGDSSEIISESGWVVPPSDAEQMTRALQSFMSMQPEERINLGSKARQRVEARYTLAGTVSNYDRLYKNLLANKE